MKKIICTTTINAPTEAIRKYDAMKDWDLLVVGDAKTPDYKLERGYFMGCDEQMDRYRDLCDLIGWNSVARGRMIAWIEAYKRGADILASIDDDCVPMENWGKRIHLGRKILTDVVETNEIVFDPITPFDERYYARGFPRELINKEQSRSFHGVIAYAIPLVQVDLCKGQGDFDAIERLCVRDRNDNQEFDAPNCNPYYGVKFSPINTQNTFIHRSVTKDFPANIPFIGRADDIWAGYIFQALHPNSTIYCAPTAIHHQDRSIQSIVDDLEQEIFMYRHTYNFLLTITEKGLPVAMEKYLPRKSIEAINIYREYFND